MGLFNKAWKILTEDPSKDISKKNQKEDIKVEKITQGSIEKKIEPTEPSLIEKLTNLKNSTYLSQDVSIKEITIHNRRYEYGWNRYHTYSQDNIYDNIYDILIEVSGRTIFDRLVPDFQGLSEIDIMGRPGRYDYHCGVLKIDNHKLKVKKVNIWMTVWEETESYHYYGDKDSKSKPFYKSQIKSVLIERETIGGEVAIRDISNLSSIQSQSLGLNNVIFNHSDSIRGIAETDLKNEIESVEKEKYLTELINSFNELDKDTLDDLLVCVSDNLGHHKVMISDKKQQGSFNYFVKGLDNFWNIKIDVSEFKNENSTYTLSMNGKLSNIIIEIGESIERMKRICDKSNIEMSFSENEIILTIRPLYPHWLSISPVNENKKRNRFGNAHEYYNDYYR